MFTKLTPIAVCLLIFSTNLFSYSYQVTIKNGVHIDDYNYQFDIVIKGVSGIVELTSYQVSLNYNFFSQVELQFSYIDGTSELRNKPTVAIGVLTNDTVPVFTFASLPRNEITEIDTIWENETLVGRFLLNSTSPLVKEEFPLHWNFSGKAATILTGPGFTDITNPTQHFPATIPNNPGKSIANNTTNPKETLINEFELLQNYPNPFNPVTTISYKVPFDSFIQIKIFNTLGEEVKNSVGEFLSPGIYHLHFDAKSLPSGFYIYSFYANNNIIDKKKMILLK